MGAVAVFLMAAVCVACAAAAVGLWRCARWGYWLAIIILIINLIGDIGNFVVAHDWRTLLGIPVAGTMIAYLICKRGVFV